jgi:hypothetical protein
MSENSSNIIIGSSKRSRIKDVTGNVYGKFTVIALSHQSDDKERTFWHCKCECGSIHVTEKSAFKTLKKQRGCMKCSSARCSRNSPFFKDITGKKFGHLTVLSLIENSSPVTWNCLCDCGKEIKWTTTTLIQGIKTNCGCKTSELRRAARVPSLIGKTFGNYKVLCLDTETRTKRGKPIVSWKCECGCGNINYLTSDELKNHNGKACRSCWGNHYSGEQAFRWDANLKPEDRNERSQNPENKDWIIAVYKRDGYKCVITGKFGKICAHHIESWFCNKNLRFDLNNGVTLLSSVHEYFHLLYGKKTRNTRAQFEEFKKDLSLEEIFWLSSKSQTSKIIEKEEHFTMLKYIVCQIFNKNGKYYKI